MRRKFRRSMPARKPLVCGDGLAGRLPGRTLGHGATLRALSLRADQQVVTREGSDWGKAIECPRRW